MLFLCITYCIPLLWFLFYVAGPFFVIFGLFTLKRGIQNRAQHLRQNGIFTMFGAVLKMTLIDVHMLSEGIKNTLCFAGRFPGLDCEDKAISPHETMFLSFLGLVLLVLCSVIFLRMYQTYLPDRKPREYSPEQVHLKFWVNLTLWTVIIEALWGVAPWLGALLDAKLPRIFLAINWKALAVFNLCMLVCDFWKVESVIWENKSTDSREVKARRTHLQQTWSSKDTLWMTLFLYLLVCGLSYIGNDVLTVKKDEPVQHRFHLNDYVPNVDISNPALKNGGP